MLLGHGFNYLKRVSFLDMGKISNLSVILPFHFCLT